MQSIHVRSLRHHRSHAYSHIVHVFTCIYFTFALFYLFAFLLDAVSLYGAGMACTDGTKFGSSTWMRNFCDSALSSKPFVGGRIFLGIVLLCYLCMYVCMCVCVCMCVYVCMYVRMYVCICVCARVCDTQCYGRFHVPLQQQSCSSTRGQISATLNRPTNCSAGAVQYSKSNRKCYRKTNQREQRESQQCSVRSVLPPRLYVL